MMSKSELLWRKTLSNDGASASYAVVEQGGDLEEVIRTFDHHADSFEPVPAHVIEGWMADVATDSCSREAIKQRVRTYVGIYTASELLMFEQCLQLERKGENDGIAANNIVSSSFSTIQTETVVVEGGVHGRAWCLIRADLLDVLAYFCDNHSTAHMKYTTSSNVKQRKLLEVVNLHHAIWYNRVIVKGFTDREFVVSMIWRAESGGGYLICFVSIDEHEGAPRLPDVVRGEVRRVIRLRPESAGVTRWSLTFTTDLKGNFPAFITRRFVIPQSLKMASLHQRYFQLLKDSLDFDADGEDAKLLAQLLMDDISARESSADRKSILQEYCLVRSAALRSISGKHPWFPLLLWRIIQNHPQQSRSPCPTPLSDITNSDAVMLGKSFAFFLRGSVTHERAIESWLTAYPSLSQLDLEIAVLRPLLCSIAGVLASRFRADASTSANVVVDDWEADAATDKRAREVIKVLIREDQGVYTAEENELFELGLEIERNFTSVDANTAKSFKTKNSFVDARTAFVGNILYANVTCTIRADLIDVLSLYMHNDSLLETKHDRASTTLDRKTLEVVNNHRSIFYLAVKLPTGFSPREFIGDNLWRKVSEKEYFVVNIPGKHASVPPCSDFVRAESFRAVRLTETDRGITKYCLTFSMDMKGSFPTVVTNKVVIPANLDGPVAYRKYFQLIKPASEFDDKGEDATTLAHLVADDFRNAPEVERRVVLNQYFNRAESLRSVAAQYPFFQELVLHMLKKKKTPLQFCIPCAARLEEFTEVDASVVGRSFACCLRGSLTPHLAVNMWLATYPALVELDAYIVFFRPFVLCIATRLFGASGDAAIITRKTMAMTEFMAVEKSAVSGGSFIDISQTRVVAKFVLNGARDSPSSEEERAWLTARRLSEMRKCFDKSLEVDRMRRDEFCAIVSAADENYNASEDSALKRGALMFQSFEGQRSTSITLSTPVTRGKLMQCKVVGEDKFSQVGMSWGLVRASAAEVLAFVWDGTSRHNRREDDLERSVDEALNRHNQVLYIKKRTPAIIDNRDFLARVVWRAIDGGVFEQVTLPEDNESKRPRQHGVVRAKYPSAMKITTTGKCEARVEYVIHPDFGGTVPQWLLSLYMGANLSWVTEIQDYFRHLRQLSEMDEKDGAAVGEVFMLRSLRNNDNTKGPQKEKTHKHKIRVASVVTKHDALKEYARLNPWFPSLVEGMLNDWLRDPVRVRTRLDNLSNKEALTIGKGFALTLFDRHQADAAVDMFVGEHECLIDLKKRDRFFVPMATVIGQRKLDRAPWGLVFKVGTGAALSLADLATDLYAIWNFSMLGQHGFARAIIISISCNFGFEMLHVYGQGNKRGAKHLFFAALIVLSGMKPVVDAYKVISGKETHAGNTVRPEHELAMSRIIEVVTESIPSSLVQIYAIFFSSSRSPASFLSIAVSIACISMASTTVCFDFDLSPSNRSQVPEFYGYVPPSSGRRTAVLLLMFSFTAFHVSVRLLGVALLAVVSPVVVAAVLGGDVLCYLLFKFVRGDLRYFILLEGTLSWIVSFVVRLFQKLMVDFTVMVQLRHPNEMGGFYWIITLVFGQAASFIGLFLYSRIDADATMPSPVDLLLLMGVLEFLFIASFGSFVAMTKEKYRKTFFSTATGIKYNHDLFKNGASDEVKAWFVDLHPTYYVGIREEVSQFVRDNYSKWVEEKPDWFTERVKSLIPVDMIPTEPK